MEKASRYRQRAKRNGHRIAFPVGNGRRPFRGSEHAIGFGRRDRRNGLATAPYIPASRFILAIAWCVALLAPTAEGSNEKPVPERVEVHPAQIRLESRRALR